MIILNQNINMFSIVDDNIKKIFSTTIIIIIVLFKMITNDLRFIHIFNNDKYFYINNKSIVIIVINRLFLCIY